MFASSDIDNDLRLKDLRSCRVEVDSEDLSLLARDSTKARMNVDLFVVILDVEYRGGAILVFQGDSLVFCLDANVSVAEIELFFEEIAFGLGYLAHAAEFLVSTILDLHDKRFLFNSWAWRIEHHNDCA